MKIDNCSWNANLTLQMVLKELLDPSTFENTCKMTVTATKINEKAWLGAKLELFRGFLAVEIRRTNFAKLKSSNFAPSQAFSLIFVAVTVILQVYSNVEGSRGYFNIIWRALLVNKHKIPRCEISSPNFDS